MRPAGGALGGCPRSGLLREGADRSDGGGRTHTNFIFRGAAAGEHRAVRIVHWFRKDLRLSDNTALHHAVQYAKGDVVPLYVGEPAILTRPDMCGRRVRFVLEALRALEKDVKSVGGKLILRHGDAAKIVAAVAREVGADAVYWNEEYEPALRARDRAVADALERQGTRCVRFHDRLLVAPGEVRTQEGKPFTVFTPFQRACLLVPQEEPLPRVVKLATARAETKPVARAEDLLPKLGLEHGAGELPDAGEAAAKARWIRFAPRLAGYSEERDRMDVDGTSRLSIDLKFGTISPRTLAALVAAAAKDKPAARKGAEKYVSEMRWRDFYAHVLFHFPHVEKRAFRPEYDSIRWEESTRYLEAWIEGRTGYPVVDAAMRCLRATGWMHNRARMIVASFLVKDLGLDWRHGERHFMRELLDGDLASNNGGWQWAASTGTDAAPYFRIFNPVLQGKKFDPDGAFVKKWIPELGGVPGDRIHAPWELTPIELAAAGVTLGKSYPKPVVDHGEARDRTMARFAAVKK